MVCGHAVGLSCSEMVEGFQLHMYYIRTQWGDRPEVAVVLGYVHVEKKRALGRCRGAELCSCLLELLCGMYV